MNVFSVWGIWQVMVSRMALILYILQAKAVVWLYEQPTSSILWSHPRMERFIADNAAYRVHTWMGSYGAASPKGTTLWCARPSVKKLCRVLPNKQWSAQMTTKTVLASGKVSVNGGADLKGSQAYTCEFGMATLSMWLEENTLATPDLSKAQIPDFWKYLPKKDRWDDANVAEVLQYLSLS